MKEFVYGTDAQFQALDNELSSGKKYKFANRQLPVSCTPDVACIWFAKIDDVYFMYIDKGIITSADNQDFKAFLERGVTKFICLEDMVAFLRSLKSLFPQTDGEENHEQIEVQVHTGGENAGSPRLTSSEGVEHIEEGSAQGHFTDSVVDKQKLRDIKASERKPKMVWPEDLAAPLKKKVFGQDRVIDALADKVVINQMRKNKKLLVIAFVGPTATGKSETAKSLADIMSVAYGTPYGFIEIAGSELIGEHTVHRFFGAPPGYIGHGQPTILDPVRNNPHHVIVINEIEKADAKILVGLMEAIDTGKLGMADNSKPIDLNQCILLFTSNIPINMEKYEECTDFEQAEMCRDAFTKQCGYPEISGKIGNFLVFRPLDEMATTDIIIKFVREELDSFDLKLAHIDEYLMADFLKHQTKYGARGIRELVSDSVGRHLLRVRKLEEFKDKAVTMKGTIDSIEFEIA